MTSVLFFSISETMFIIENLLNFLNPEILFPIDFQPLIATKSLIKIFFVFLSPLDIR